MAAPSETERTVQQDSLPPTTQHGVHTAMLMLIDDGDPFVLVDPPWYCVILWVLRRNSVCW